MRLYQLDYTSSAAKQLRAVKDVRLKAALDGLITTPRPVGCLKMTGRDDLWRIRVGEWRVVYRIEDARLVVMVIAVAPRGGVYR
jgi:mRNA interferase RelE/StbE